VGRVGRAPVETTRDRGGYPGRGGRAGRRSPWLPVAWTAALAATTGCGGPADRSAPALAAADSTAGRGYVIEALPPERLRLQGATSSLNDLLRTVERGLAESDTARLYDLMISEREYRDILYPAFPAAHPPINASFETLWVLQYGDAYRGLHRILARYGGHEVRVTAIRFNEPDQDFVNFVLHGTSRVDVTVDGEPLENVRLFGSVVRIADQWKVLTYPDHPDDPE